MKSSASSPKPPYNDEEPEDENEEDYVPQPATALARSHVVHAAEGACQNARGFGESIILRR